LVHFIDEKVDVLGHLLKFVSQMFVLLPEVLLPLIVLKKVKKPFLHLPVCRSYDLCSSSAQSFQ
jgi:hypothetical protein